MVVDFAGPILDLLDQYGLFALFVLLALDAAMLLPVVPGELLLAVAASRFGTNPFMLGVVIVVASLAATTGNLLMYGIARGAGKGFVERHPKLFLMSPRRREQMERLFQRPAGQSLALFLRLVPVARLLVSLPAGLARMPVIRFAVLSLIGNTLFHLAFMFIAFESRDPNSTVSVIARNTNETFASPAWAYAQANWAIVALGGVSLGVLLTFRAARNAQRNPLEAERSFFGFLARLVLFWGGIAVLLGLWLDPEIVYQVFLLGGVDVTTLAPDVPFAPLSVVAGIGGGALIVWLVASTLWRAGKKRVKAAKRLHRLKAQLDAQPRAVHEQRLRPPG